MFADEVWIFAAYDSIVAAAGDDGITAKESREAFAARYETAVRKNEIERRVISPYDEGLEIYDRMVKPERRQRSRRLSQDWSFIVAAINDETVLGKDDPVLQVACPLGDAAGTDKIVGLWTVENIRNATVTRYRKAAEATAAAAEFDQLASTIERALIQRAVDRISDLFT